jgi:hypothetical protein
MSQVVHDVVKMKLPTKSPLRERLFDFCKYIKPYDGLVLNRETKEMETRKFYDEREWRYSPANVHTLPSTGSDDRPLKQANKALRSHALKFAATDVKYIIVSKESEIPKTIAAINKIGTLQLREKWSNPL